MTIVFVRVLNLGTPEVAETEGVVLAPLTLPVCNVHRVAMGIRGEIPSVLTTPVDTPTALPTIEYMSSLADIIAQETQDGQLIVREETDDGRAAVRFLIEAMQGQLPDFKPCHHLSAAKELRQRGFDYIPDDADPQAATIIASAAWQSRSSNDDP